MAVSMPQPVSFDFETIGIENRPHYPPSPVGVSIKYWGKKSRYYGFGHVNGGNNSTFGEARQALAKVFSSRAEMLCWNAKFDFAVAAEHFDLPFPSWERMHDGLFLAYLDDPRAQNYKLKYTAAKILGWDPEERDVIEDWLVEHQPIPGKKITRGNGKNGAGKFIAYAPGDIVGPYANGDVDRTEALFRHLWKSIKSRGMLNAYQRERETLEVLLDMEPDGVQVNYKRLCRDNRKYQRAREDATAWVCKRLRQPNDVDEFNPDSDQQLLQALVAAGKVDESRLLVTEKGNLSASKESLSGAMTDRTLQEMLAYRSELNTCLDMFMLNYEYTASQNGERRIFTDWNQVRKDHKSGRRIVGTTTGRLSSTPNFQNISNQFDPHFKHLAATSAIAKALPKCPLELPPLPLVRSYITPFPGDVLIDRDYSQQELRILGHYEQGPLTQAYHEDPWLDVHDWAKDMINALLFSDFPRRPIKDIGFGLIYGMGVGKLAWKAETDVVTAKKLKKAYLTVAPGLQDLYKDMKLRARDEEPIYTWGEREYYCEEPKLIDGRMRQFDYKMLNILIQGSAADCTKQAFINYHRAKPPEHRLILQVHDQLTASIPREDLVDGMECLREAMESVEFDIPMLSEGDWSDTNWDKSSLIPYDKKGELLYAA